MEKPLTEAVRSACRKVAERATSVRIDYGVLPVYASSLPVEEAGNPSHDSRSHYLNKGDDTVGFFLTLDSINFGSGYFPHLKKRSGMSGYFTVARSLKDLYEKKGPLSAEKLSELTIDDCTDIFGQDPANEPVRELMGLFTSALNDLGNYVLNTFSGSFVKLVEAADSSAERLACLLTEMPFFDDQAEYDTIRVPFYKRAQLTAADISLAFLGQGIGYFKDLDHLTIFADNLVPHVLRVDKVLLYEDSLARRIDGGVLLDSGSQEEIEIRACALHAVELLRGELLGLRKMVTSLGLDYLLWNRGQKPYYKSIPRHRARTVFY